MTSTPLRCPHGACRLCSRLFGTQRFMSPLAESARDVLRYFKPGVYWTILLVVLLAMVGPFVARRMRDADELPTRPMTWSETYTAPRALLTSARSDEPHLSAIAAETPSRFQKTANVRRTGAR